MRITTPGSLGKYIAQRRQKAGYSQMELGKRIGKDQRFISRVETKTSSITFANLMKVMAALDIRFDITSSADDGDKVVDRVTKATTIGKHAVDGNSPKTEHRPLDSLKSNRRPVVIRKSPPKK